MFLRTFNVSIGLVLTLYWTLFLLCPYFKEGPPKLEFENGRPGASVCACLDVVPAGYFIRDFSVTNSRNRIQGASTKTVGLGRRMFMVIVFMLMLSGDVELNPGPVSKSFQFAHLNARSVIGDPSVDKPTLIQNFITDGKIDILAISETWLRPNSLPATINSLIPDGYTCMHVPRDEGRGGGVAFIYRSVFEFRQVEFPCFASAEFIVAKLILNSTSFIFATFYRPPSSS